MIQQSGVQWDVEEFDTGHAPFLSPPQRLGAWTINEISMFELAGSSKGVATS